MGPVSCIVIDRQAVFTRRRAPPSLILIAVWACDPPPAPGVDDHLTPSAAAARTRSPFNGFTRYATMPGRSVSAGAMRESPVASTIAVAGEIARI